MAKRNIIVIGASAGGFELLRRLVGDLPSHLDAAIFIVWHISSEAGTVLQQVLNKENRIHAANAVDKEPLLYNRIYIAPPDNHLLIEKDLVRVTHGPKENRFRPAIDPLFRSAAVAYGPRVIGVILSGALDDGTAGLWMIKDRGGIAVVQDPQEAEVSSMPRSALEAVEVDYILPVADMGALLARLVTEEAPEPKEVNMENEERANREIRIAAQDGPMESNGIFGDLTPYTCPECHGVLSALSEGGRIRYRCHTGHAFSSDSLLDAISTNIEENLWSAVRNIKESILLLNHIGDHLAEVNRLKLAAIYFNKAREAEARMELVRQAVLANEHLNTDSLDEEEGPK
jgi:two-component system chemotaxis response regulator CheB